MVSVKIPVSLSVTASVTGGITKDNIAIHMQRQSLHYVTVEAVIVHVIMSSESLAKLVKEIGIEIRIAHYPPYNSKYNPIEHRLFPHVTRACQGVVFKSVELVKELMEKTRTSKGLRVTVNIIDKVYRTGRKVAADFKKNMTIKFDEFLPKWNYTAVPNG